MRPVQAKAQGQPAAGVHAAPSLIHFKTKALSAEFEKPPGGMLPPLTLDLIDVFEPVA